jgi:diphthamide biosynthesis protein 2
MPIVLMPITEEEETSPMIDTQQDKHKVVVYGDTYTFNAPPIIYYIGNSKALSNLLLRYPNLSIYAYRPAKRLFEKESRLSNRLLSKRFYQMNKAKDASVFGIVIGTMGASSYLQLLPAIKEFLRLRKRKVYTFAVGKLNVPKLANFPEIDCFVHLSCPDTSILDDELSKSMYAPVVTPWELFVAIGGHDWSSEYALTFSELIARLRNSVVIPEDDEPHFSLITGKFQQTKLSDYDCQDVTVCDSNKSLNFVGSTYSQFRRTWSGLIPAIGETSVEMASQGRRGIARDYVIDR